MALGKILTNKQKGSPRFGRQYVEVVDPKTGDVVHRYGVEAGRDDVAWNKTQRANANRTSFGQPMNTGGPELAAKTAEAATVARVAAKAATARDANANAAKGGLVNQIKGSARFGKEYKNVTRGGLAGHLYANGTFVPMGKKKAGR